MGVEMNDRLMGAVAIAALLLFPACSYHRAYVDHTEYEGKMPIQEKPWDGELLGPIRAGEAGAIWEKCTDIARGSVWVLMDDTRKMGGNAIGDVRWIPQNPTRTTGDPSCKKKWGWFLLWPALVTPAFQSARVDANAYRVASERQQSGIYVIPEDAQQQALLVERILRETFGVTGGSVRRSDFEGCSSTGG